LALLDQDASLVGNIETLFTSVVSLAAVYMLTQTALATIGAFFYNLVSDLVGGIEVVVLEESHLETPQKQKINKKTKENQDDKETVLMSFVNSIKKVRENKPEEIEVPKTDLPRPDVPRDIEEPTLMDALKNTENEEDESI
jgi:hypothetical protein